MLAALPGEIKALVRGWDRLPVPQEAEVEMWRRRRGDDEVLAVTAGMGSAAIRRAFAAAEHAGSLDMVLNVGWAGGLTDAANLGVVMTEVIDVQTGEQFTLTSGTKRLRLVTTTRVADREEKRRLAASYHAVAVDMEAATVARLAEIRGIPCGCFKAISDGFDVELPDINPYIDTRGRLQVTRFLGYTALRPRYWKALAAMGRNSARASRQLAVAVEDFLTHKDMNRVSEIGASE